jgi:hypothetical protein
VAYEDARADYLKPYVLSALNGTNNPTLQQAAAALSAWDNQRTGSGGQLGPGPTFFDRWIEHFVRNHVLDSSMSDANFLRIADMDAQKHWVSTENQDAIAHKFFLSVLQVTLTALQNRTVHGWFTPGAANAAIMQAAQDAVGELGTNPSTWHEPVEHAAYGAQGAGSVNDTVPLPNRGSYGQVVEPFASGGPGTPGVGSLPNTTAQRDLGPAVLIGVVGAALAVAASRRRRRRALRR